MKRLMILLSLLASPGIALAQANALPAAPHLLVKGHAQGRYVPDRFTVRLSISVTDKSPAVARSKVEAYAKQVFAALDKYRALAGRTQASTMSIGASTQYRDNRQVFMGTEVSRTVEATFDSADKLKGFVDAIDANEQLQISGLDVARSDADELANSLRKQAIFDSQQSAQQIAKSYGMSIKSVYSVSEVAPISGYGVSFGPPPPPPPPEVSRMATQTELRIGTIELSQDIYAVYLTAP